MKFINDFEDAYKTLENLLRNVTNIDDKPLIPLFVKILPPYLSAQMETIRKFRNSFMGHGAKVDGEHPQAPNTYVVFLNKEIQWITNNKSSVCNQIRSLLKSEKCEKSQQFTHLSTVGEMILFDIKKSQIDSSPKVKQLRNMLAERFKGAPEAENRRILMVYGGKQEPSQTLEEAVADALIASMDDEELKLLISKLS